MNHEIERSEDGRPMLSFPSVEDNKPKKKQIPATLTGDPPRSETGGPKLNFNGPKNTEGFDISDRSEANQRKAIEELKRKYGTGYGKAIKNAKAVLAYADEEYPKMLRNSGLGNFPPLIIAMDALGHDLGKEYQEASKPGSMREASLNAFKNRARERINKLIFKVQNEYIAEHGSINQF